MKSSLQNTGSILISALTVPFSELASPQAKRAFIAEHGASHPTNADIIEQRKFAEDTFARPAVERLHVAFATRAEKTIMAGVPVVVVEPAGGCPGDREGKVIIYLHGGGFTVGGGFYGSQQLAIPMAAMCCARVICVDYRMAPEHTFPAATEDVVAIFRELTKSFDPKDIGIYGCSAGAILAAQTVAWLLAEKSPLPGAIGMLCGGAMASVGGDSVYTAAALSGWPENAPPFSGPIRFSYFQDANYENPLVSPIKSSTMLSQFPPALIVTATRDFLMGTAIRTHTELVKAKVPTELHVWEGLGHGNFLDDPALPEFHEAWNVIVAFFGKHLNMPR